MDESTTKTANLQKYKAPKCIGCRSEDKKNEDKQKKPQFNTHKKCCSRFGKNGYNDMHCQSYLSSINRNESIPSTCSIYKRTPSFSHCSTECKNAFIAKHKVKKTNDTKKSASFCLFYKTINGVCFFLVHKRTYPLSIHDKQIFIPGGKVECGETYNDALVREIFEETGVSLADGLSGVKILSNVNKMMMIYGMEVDTNWGMELKKEHQEFETGSYKWITFSEINDANNPDHKYYISLLQILKIIKKNNTSNHLFKNANVTLKSKSTASNLSTNCSSTNSSSNESISAD